MRGRDGVEEAEAVVMVMVVASSMMDPSYVAVPSVEGGDGKEDVAPVAIGRGGGSERSGDGRRRLMLRSSREARAAASFCARAAMSYFWRGRNQRTYEEVTGSRSLYVDGFVQEEYENWLS